MSIGSIPREMYIHESKAIMKERAKNQSTTLSLELATTTKKERPSQSQWIQTWKPHTLLECKTLSNLVIVMTKYMVKPERGRDSPRNGSKKMKLFQSHKKAQKSVEA